MIVEQKGYIPIYLTNHINNGIPCEICEKIVPMSDVHSFIVCYAMPGNKMSSYQCENEQHYGCCMEHAMLAAIACATSHLINDTKKFTQSDEIYKFKEDFDAIQSIVDKHKDLDSRKIGIV